MAQRLTIKHPTFHQMLIASQSHHYPGGKRSSGMGNGPRGAIQPWYSFEMVSPDCREEA